MGPFPFNAGGVPSSRDNGRASRDSSILPSFLLADTTQQRVGMSGNNNQGSLERNIPYHELRTSGEVVVGWDSYRDQWITEGLANYIALVGADAEKPGDHLLAHWLDYYRKDLTSLLRGRKTRWRMRVRWCTESA